jgi:hypothetical protein
VSAKEFADILLSLQRNLLKYHSGWMVREKKDFDPQAENVILDSAKAQDDESNESSVTKINSLVCRLRGKPRN